MNIWPAPGSFEQAMLPHLDAAHNLARWLTGNDQDAEDVVQEAFLRALKFFRSFRGGDGRAWLLAIVRNACRDHLRQQRSHERLSEFDEETRAPDADDETPETLLMQQVDRERVQRALGSLPLIWREVLVLRELEGMSYKEIGQVIGIPPGTVMSRLSRARVRLQRELAAPATKE